MSENEIVEILMNKGIKDLAKELNLRLLNRDIVGEVNIITLLETYSDFTEPEKLIARVEIDLKRREAMLERTEKKIEELNKNS